MTDNNNYKAEMPDFSEASFRDISDEELFGDDETKDEKYREGIENGTIKPTYCVPRSMWAGAVALAEKRPCLIVDFWGLSSCRSISGGSSHLCNAYRAAKPEASESFF